MKKTKTLTPDQKSERVHQIEAELGMDMLEKLLAGFTLLSEAMVHRAVRKAKAQCGSGRTRDDRPAQRRRACCVAALFAGAVILLWSSTGNRGFKDESVLEAPPTCLLATHQEVFNYLENRIGHVNSYQVLQRKLRVGT